MKIEKYLAAFAALLLLFSVALAETVALPAGITEIKARTFYGDTSVTEVIVPNGVTSIDSLAFAFSGLKSITIPDTVTSISETAFFGTEGLIIHAPDGSYAAEYIALRSDGGYNTFGSYPQTSSGEVRPIEWVILDRDEDSLLLISRYCLDVQPFNTAATDDITWSNCSLHTWLNGTFLNTAFTADEQTAILETEVKNIKEQHYPYYSASYKDYPDTKDKVFVLSYAEANKYYGITWVTANEAARSAPTAYAVKQGATVSSTNKTKRGESACNWWLRSPGPNPNGVISGGGYQYLIVEPMGTFVHSSMINSQPIRPALRLDISKVK